MNPDVTAALRLLVEADVESMDRAGLDVVLTRARTVCAVTDAVEVRVARRARELAAAGQSESACEVLRDGGRRAAKDAGAAARREETCGRWQTFEPALAAGAVSAAHVDALANATAGLSDQCKDELVAHEHLLLADAKRSPVEVFERHCRDIARRVSTDDGTGELAAQRRRNRIRRGGSTPSPGCTTSMRSSTPSRRPRRGRLSPRACSALKHEQQASDPSPTPSAAALALGMADAPARSSMPTAALTHDQLEAQAFVELLTGGRTVDRRTPEIIVLLDWGTLVDGLHERGVCEAADGTSLPPATARRLCCTADIVPVVLGGRGEALDVGRSRRLATAAQRRALWAMYRSCGFPGCGTPVERCEIHHVRDWSTAGGPTDLANLLPLCVRHHHTVHEGGWTLVLGTDRVLTVTRPDGSVHHRGSTTNRAPPAGPNA